MTEILPDIRNVYDLKHEMEARKVNVYFFSKANMRFAGDTMENFSLRQPKSVLHRDSDTGEIVSVSAYELARKRPVKGGLQRAEYFNAETLRKVHVIHSHS